MAEWWELLPALVGGASSIAGLVDRGRERGQQRTRYEQEQEQFKQQQALYQQALQQALLYQQQQQQMYEAQKAQQAQELALQQQLAAQRQAIATRLQDPAQVAAGGQALAVPLSDAMQAEIARNTQAEMAMRGVSQGQYANLMAARAFAPYAYQSQLAGLQSYLNSQQGALQGLQDPRFASVPTAPQYAGIPAAPQNPQAPSYVPPGMPGGTQGLADLVKNASQYLFQKRPVDPQQVGREVSGLYEPTSGYDPWAIPGITVSSKDTYQYDPDYAAGGP